MKIAILGTRGIPNQYGGFEQCAQELSHRMVAKGYDVTIFNPSDHSYKLKEWRGVKIENIYAQEKKFGIFGTFIFDYLSIKKAVKDKYDIVIELGYVPSAIFFKTLKKSRSKLITNMDGLEWKRTKWNWILKKFVKYCEKKAVFNSDLLISDNIGIQTYLKNEYNKESNFIPYGAELFNDPDISILDNYNLEKKRYSMLIARLEPENNIEMIIDGYNLIDTNEPLLVVGNQKTKYGQKLVNKYKLFSNIKFIGGIYDYNVLSTLRWYSKYYYHGHTVGGTNPSLLEAMASNAYIVAHDNPFNKNVIGNDAKYFKNINDIKKIFSNGLDSENDFINNNRQKIKDLYSWDLISDMYINVIKELV